MKRKRGLYRVDSRDDKQGDAGTRTSTLPAEVFKRMQALDELLLERNKEVAKLKEEVLLYRTFNERFRITERRAALFEGARQLYTPEAECAFTIAFSQITSWSARYIFHTPTVDDATCKSQAEKAVEVLHRHLFRTVSAEELYGILRDGRLRFALALDLAIRFLCLHVYRTFGIEEAPVERGLDFWLDEDLRSSFAKLENNIRPKGQSARFPRATVVSLS